MTLKIRNLFSELFSKLGMKRISYFIRISSVGLVIYGGDALAQGTTSELKPSARRQMMMESEPTLDISEMIALIEQRLADPFLTEQERQELLNALARFKREEDPTN